MMSNGGEKQKKKKKHAFEALDMPKRRKIVMSENSYPPQPIRQTPELSPI
jgi:hypothetical protein